MRFKDLRTKLAEGLLPTDVYGGYVGGTKIGPMDSSDNAVDTPNASIHQLSQRELQRLNTFVGAVEAKCYIDPNTAINQMKQKLFSQGISFDFNQESMLEDGVHAFPLKQYGGREGHDGTSYNPIKDDGISHRLGHGLNLMISVQKEIKRNDPYECQGCCKQWQPKSRSCFATKPTGQGRNARNEFG